MRWRQPNPNRRRGSGESAVGNIKVLLSELSTLGKPFGGAFGMGPERQRFKFLTGRSVELEKGLRPESKGRRVLLPAQTQRPHGLMMLGC